MRLSLSQKCRSAAGSSVDQVRDEQDEIGQEYEQHHFQEDRQEERQSLFGVFVHRTLDDGAYGVDGRTDGGRKYTHRYDGGHQDTEVHRVDAHLLHHGQEDGGQQQEVDVAVQEHAQDKQPGQDDDQQLRLIGDAQNELGQGLGQLDVGHSVAEGAGHGDEQHDGSCVHNGGLQSAPELLPGQLLVDERIDQDCE